jgi:hypothetical protein
VAENQGAGNRFEGLPGDLARKIISVESREAGLCELCEANLPNAPQIATNFLSDKSAFVRSAALKVLQAHGDDTCAESVLPLLHDTDEIVRVNAVEALERMDYFEALPEMKHLAVNDPEEIVRAYAAWAVGRLGDEEERPFLEAGLAAEASLVAKAGFLYSLSVVSQDILSLRKMVSLLPFANANERHFILENLHGLAIENENWKGEILAVVRAEGDRNDNPSHLLERINKTLQDLMPLENLL